MMRFRHQQPANDADFEVLCLKLLRRRWEAPQLQLYAHKGEGQDGVDIFDTSGREPVRGAQCKLHEPDKNIQPQEIRAEVRKALSFQPRLDHFTILTTAKVSKQAQKTVRDLNVEHRAQGLFTVELLAWAAIEELLDEFPEVARECYPSASGAEVAQIGARLASLDWGLAAVQASVGAFAGSMSTGLPHRTNPGTGGPTWPPWPKADALGLVRYATPDAANWLTLNDSPLDLTRDADGRSRLVESIYNALVAKQIRYALEKYHPAEPLQEIRPPAEILDTPLLGTCLDLAVLFSGLCLSYELVPILIVVDGHALVAIDLNHGRRHSLTYGRTEGSHFETEGFVRGEQAAELLRNLVARGDYLAVECTGFARTESLPEDVPEGIGREGGLLRFERATAAGQEQIDHPDRPVRFAIDVAVAQDRLGIQPYRVGRPGGEGWASPRRPTGRVAPLRDAGTSMRDRILQERIGFLETRERVHIDKEGKSLWQDIQRSLSRQDFAVAVSKGRLLLAWLSGDGRRATRSVRGRANILLADLAAVKSSQEGDPDSIDLAEARRREKVARQEFGANLSEKDAARLATLAAKLEYPEGRPEAALELLDGCEDPSCISLRLSILIGRDRPGDAAAIADLPLHARWCDKAVLAHLMAGNPIKAGEAVAWARGRDDVTCYHRCLLAAARGTAYRVFGGWAAAARALPGTLSDTARADLGTILADLKPLLRQAEVKERATTGLEIDAVDIAASTCYLLGDSHGRAKYAGLLGEADPVPLRFGHSVTRGDVPAPADLPGRLRRDHPRSFEAHLLAALIEGEKLGHGDRAFDAALACKALTTTAAQRERLCGMLYELSAFVERPEADVEVLAAARELLGEAHRLVGTIELGRTIEAGRLEDARALLEGLRDDDDPLWWQLSARWKIRSGDDPGALDDLIRASSLLPRAQLLDGVAGLATKLGRYGLARETLGQMLDLDPDDERARRNLALACLQLQRFDQAAAEFGRLARMKPDEPAYTVNQALALVRAGRPDEALEAFDAAGRRHPSLWPVLEGKANLLHTLGRPDEAFQTLHQAREQFWSEPGYLTLYMSLAFGAGREDEAGMAIKRLVELHEAGQGDSSRFQVFRVEDVKDLFQQRLNRRREIDEAVLAGRLPWLSAGAVLGRTAYADWWEHTHTCDSDVPDHPVGRAEFTIYSTNGYTPLPVGIDGPMLWPISCPPAGRPIVADLTSLIAAHQLGLLDELAAYFGRVLVPAEYPALLRSEQGVLRPRRRVRVEALRAIRTAAAEGVLRPWAAGEQGGANPAILDEHREAGESPTRIYRLADVGHWLRLIGRIGDREFERLRGIGHKPSEAGVAPLDSAIAGSGLLADVETLIAFAELGWLPHLLASARVYIERSVLDSVHREWRRIERDEDLVRSCGVLSEVLLSDARFERVGLGSAARSNEGEETLDERLSGTIAAFLLAEQENLPLLVDDRTCQAGTLNRRPGRADGAFGIDTLLFALAKAGRLTIGQVAEHCMQLIRWRYRFLVPSAEVLVEIASGFIGSPPGQPLRDVSHYVHDCMRDTGLFGGLEATSPQVSMAMHLFQEWSRLVGEFVAMVWLDPRFDDDAASKLTDWAVRECLPGPPRSVPPMAQNLLCGVVPQSVLIGALMSARAMRNPARTNRALRELSRALGLSDLQYMHNVTALVAAADAAGCGPDANFLAFLRHMVSTALAHFDAVDHRTYLVLDRIGMGNPENVGIPSIEDLSPILDPGHPRHIPTIAGPMALVAEVSTEEVRIAVSVPSLIVETNARVRAIGLDYFDRLGGGAGSILSPRTRSVLAEYGAEAREADFDRWHPAATRIYEVLGEDFLLNLAGFRQEILYGLRGEDGSYWGRVLNPGVWLFATVPEEVYRPGLVGIPTADVLHQYCIEGVDALDQALARYGDRFGHLPLAPPLSLGTLLREWVERNGEGDIWETVWSWAGTLTDPLRRYHACRAFVENPGLIPDGMHGRLWKEAAQILAVSRIGGTRERGSGAWQAVCDLARHYLHQLELHAPVHDTERLVCLAWWAARNVVSCLDLLGREDEAAVELIGRLHEQSIGPAAKLSRAAWRVVRPLSPASVLRYATFFHSCLWSLSLLSALDTSMAQIRPEIAPAEAREAITAALIVNLHQAYPLMGEDVQGARWCLSSSLHEAASCWANLILDPEESGAIESLAIAVAEFRDARVLMERLVRLLVLDADEQRLCGCAFHAACYAGDILAEDVWKFVTDGDWLRRCVVELPTLVLSDLLEGLSALQGRVGDNWNWWLPHLFAQVADSPDLSAERRNLMVSMTIIASANAGTVSAVRRLAEGEHRAVFLPELAELRDRLGRLMPIGPPWASARFRDLLSCLPPA
jgi:tetratricopeptide (TPR) repeat protein